MSAGEFKYLVLDLNLPEIKSIIGILISRVSTRDVLRCRKNLKKSHRKMAQVRVLGLG